MEGKTLRVNPNPQLETTHLSFNNPSSKVCEAIPQIEQHFQVTVQMYCSEYYHNLTLIIKGNQSNVKQAYSELLSINDAAN